MSDLVKFYKRYEVIFGIVVMTLTSLLAYGEQLPWWLLIAAVLARDLISFLAMKAGQAKPTTEGKTA